MIDIFLAFIGGVCCGGLVGLYVIVCVDHLKGGDKS